MTADASLSTTLASPAGRHNPMTPTELADGLTHLADQVVRNQPFDAATAAVAVAVHNALFDLIASTPLPDGWTVDEVTDAHTQILDNTKQCVGHIHRCEGVYIPVLALLHGPDRRMNLRAESSREQAIAKIVAAGLHLRS